MRIALTTLLLTIIIGACGGPGLPGHIFVSKSREDGRLRMHMEPAWVPDSAIRLSLYWHSEMPPHQVVLEVLVRGPGGTRRSGSVEIELDGEVTAFGQADHGAPADAPPRHFPIPGTAWISRYYPVSTAFIEHMIKARKAMIHVRSGEQSFRGLFSRDYPTAARPAFRYFLDQLKRLQPEPRRDPRVA